MFITVSDWLSRELTGRDKVRLFRDEAGFLTEPSVAYQPLSRLTGSLSAGLSSVQ